MALACALASPAASLRRAVGCPLGRLRHLTAVLLPPSPRPLVAVTSRAFASSPMLATGLPHLKKALAEDGFLCLTYPSKSLKALESHLYVHGASIYSSANDYIGTAVVAYEVDGKPALELLIQDTSEEVRATAVTNVGETLIMGMLYGHRDFTAMTRDVQKKPLELAAVQPARGLKIPVTGPSHIKRTLADDGFLSLAYDDERLNELKEFLLAHGATVYNTVSDNVDSGILAYAVDSQPALEIFVSGAWEELHVTALTKPGETLIMGLGFKHRDYIAIGRDLVRRPLEMKPSETRTA